MPITLTKTLQTVEYDLYMKTIIAAALPTFVVASLDIYESSGHCDDGFVAIIKKQQSITDSATVATVLVNRFTNQPVAIAAIENYLVANVAWYSGGIVS
jgi:hypothetical protein